MNSLTTRKKNRGNRTNRRGHRRPIDGESMVLAVRVPRSWEKVIRKRMKLRSCSQADLLRESIRVALFPRSKPVDRFECADAEDAEFSNVNS